MYTNNSHFPHGEAIAWYLPENAPYLPLSPLKNWLLSKGSLTKKLKDCCMQFEVQILGEGEIFPEKGEWQVQETLWVREVLLCLDGTPWIFARTLIPPQLMALTKNSLKKLGSRPLGELLFSEEAFIPGKIEIAHFDCCTKLTALVRSLSQPCKYPLWGRRRYFNYQQQSLIVSEIFLPAAISVINKDV